MSQQRLSDWRLRLDQTIDKARQLNFEWGVFDCALHVSNCIRATTGVDPAESYRGTYSDEAGAARIYGSNFEDFIASQSAALGLKEVPVTFARRGDVVFVDNNTTQGCVGVVSMDPRFVCCAGDKGLILVPIVRWKRAWQVA